MRVVFFRLKGYVRVLNGMGLDEIAIPFGDFKNRIILIQGENGCSKSTIIQALSPTPDNSDSYRTDVFIDSFGNRQIIEYPAEKEIWYESVNELGNIDHIRILIQSIVNESKTSRTTKAFISKNGEELNPNGNVTSFKEIRDAVLGIDPIYLDLSSISSENRGIVDMIPSERRKYMASYIGSLDTYNNIFKIISKKVTTLKSYMNTLNTKLYELGDENELRLKQAQLQTTLKDKNGERDSLIKKLAEAESIVQIIDPENKMQDLYTSISERLGTINSEMSEIKRNLDRELMLLKIDPENCEIETYRNEVVENIKRLESEISEAKAKANTLLSLNEATSASIESDKTMLSGISTDAIQDNIEQAVKTLQEEVDMYMNYLTEEDISILKSVSIEELEDLRNSFKKFTQEIGVIEDSCDSDDLIMATYYIFDKKAKDNIRRQIEEHREESKQAEITISNLQKDIETILAEIEELKDFESSRPKNCKIDDCPYIARFVKLKKNGKTRVDIEFKQGEIENLRNTIAGNDLMISQLTGADKVIAPLELALSIIQSKSSVISRIPSLVQLNSLDYLKEKIQVHYRFPEFGEVDSIIEKSKTYSELKRAQEQLKGLEGDLKIYLNNKSMIDNLTSSISKNEGVYHEREEEIKRLTREYNFNTTVVDDFSNILAGLDRIIGLRNRLADLEKEKEELKREFDSVKDKIKLVKDKVDSVNIIKADIEKVEEEIKPLEETINHITYALSNIIGYRQEYADSSNKYEKMLFIRNACSPGNGLGIQSEYIKRYMNDIIIDCNQMLSYMFGGTIQLEVPIINEKQFSIPFIGPNGIVVPDISEGSTAQKCMIGLVFSCVAMMKSSIKYNIPRFDEIDGGLDPGNRITFINVLNEVLDFMNSEQCIICSHNTEFDTQNTTRLLFSHNGIRIEQ